MSIERSFVTDLGNSVFVDCRGKAGDPFAGCCVCPGNSQGFDDLAVMGRSLRSGQNKNRHSLIRQKDAVLDDFPILSTIQRYRTLVRGTQLPVPVVSSRTDAVE